MSNDKYGRDYAKLVALQGEQLAQWKKVLRPEVYAYLAEYCEMINGEAEPYKASVKSYKSGGLHSCPVGSELHHIVMEFGKKPETDNGASLL